MSHKAGNWLEAERNNHLLDYQAYVLRAYFGEGVRVRELNTDKIMEYLTKGRDE